MKKILIALGVIVVLLVAAVIIVPLFIPLETYKAEIESQVREQTGREFAIRGDVDLALFPNVALEVNDVVFGNMAGGRAENMASLKTLQIDVQLMPLLGGELAIDRFVLIDPQINLEVGADGKANWDVMPAGEAPEAAPSEGGGPGLDQLRLGDVRLENGRISFFDAKTGAEHVISDVNMKLFVPDLESKLKAEGSLVWNGETITLTLNSDPLRKLMRGETIKAALSVASNPVTLDFSGTVAAGDAPGAQGDVTLMVPSVRGLAGWLGNPMPEGNGFGNFSLAGTLAATPKKASYTNARIEFDQIKGTGEFAVDSSGAVPALSGRLDLEQLDVNPYMPETQEAAEQGPAEWSDEPIDASALKLFNANFTLTAQGIKARNIVVGKSALTLVVQGGKLTADLTEFNLYDGTGTGGLVVDASGDRLSIAERFALTGVQAQGLLRDMGVTERLSGTGNLNMDITAGGNSQRQLVQNLNGKGGFEFRDGAITGINLGAMIRNIGSAFLDPSAQETQKTDFSELTATFVIKNGILTNNDMKMLSPLFRVTGAGTVDLPQRTVDYKVTPKAVASAEGQGGAQEATGIAVPVLVTGPWHDLSYKPDLAGMITDPAALTEGAAKAVEGLTGGAAGAVEGITGGAAGAVEGVTGGLKIPGIEAPAPAPSGEAAPAPAGEGGTGLPDPTKAIKGLFGN